ncbi:MAG: ACT domain-containing protein [Veillonellaceae bacterium]|nr:ACT domain-containing protein [Veillonellaceae bacterium]
MKVVVTIVGQDRVGIIAAVSKILAENNINILKINQTILDGFFNMVMIADMTESKVNLATLQQMLGETGKQMGLQMKAQHEGIFRSMHRI